LFNPVIVLDFSLIKLLRGKSSAGLSVRIIPQQTDGLFKATVIDS
jgi:hypothetical protein